MTDIILSTQNGEPVASSRQIAENFGKEHKDTLESIRQILAAENSATKSMFYETTFENRGKQYPMYLMNRDGFSLLVMGFTGKAALEWKLKYIQAFNEMEKKLATPQMPKLSKELQDWFRVNSVGNIPRKRFDEAVEYIQRWKPSTNTVMLIQQTNGQTSMF